LETTKKAEETQGFFINFGQKNFDVMSNGRRVGRAYIEFKKVVRSSLRLRVQIYGRTRNGKINKWKIAERFTVKMSLEATVKLLQEIDALGELSKPKNNRWQPEVKKL